MNERTAIQSLRDCIRRKHLALSTERSYVYWLRQYCSAIKAYPAALDTRARIERFLSTLALQRVSASTQNQAFNAILFFYRHVLKTDPGPINALRAKRPQHIRTAPSFDEIRDLLLIVRDIHQYPTRLIVHLLYACGLRVSEPLNLRFKDVHLDARRLDIRDGKGSKDRVVRLPDSLADPISAQLTLASCMWQRDRANGIPVPLPGRLDRKYPSARHSLPWYWLFPSHKPCRHPRTGETVRWRCHQSNVQRAVRSAAREVGLDGLVTPHVLRHAYATHAIERGASIRDVQAALGHKHLDTTMRYVTPDALNVPSPLEAAAC